MEFKPKESYSLYGRIDAFNTSDGIINMAVTLMDDTGINIKVNETNSLEIGKVYLFDFTCLFNGTRNQLILNSYKDALCCQLCDEVYDVYKKFYPYVPVGIKALEDKLDMYIDMIDNRIIKTLVMDIFSRYRHDFLIYPAAVKMHHNYIGGLAYHSLTMCDLALGFGNIYENLDRNYLLAGALLHDIAKVIEFNSPIATEYSVKGQLLGHLVLGAMELDRTAGRLGLRDTEEVLILEHMIISHHGQPQFGACKKPETPEALILWILDTIDSKMRVIDDTFPNVNEGDFSDALGVLDRMKFYKKKEN